MKRATIVIAALALAACGKPSAPAPTPEPAPAATAEAPAAPAAGAHTPDQIAALIKSLPAPYNAGDYENGKRVFAQCRACHTIGAGEPNRIGPHLHGVFGRKAGSVADFSNYSAGLKASGITWDADKLNTWTTNPRGVVAQTNMVFPGVHSDTDRRDLIAFLKVESSD